MVPAETLLTYFMGGTPYLECKRGNCKGVDTDTAGKRVGFYS